MDGPSERLEVSLPSSTRALLRQEARRRGVPEAQVVQEAVERLLAEARQTRVRAAEALFRVEARVADWAQMEQEIEAARIAAKRP
jgi:6-phosphogluconate dehydrogenase